MSDTFKKLLTTRGQQAGPFLQGAGGLYHKTLGHGLDLAVAHNAQVHLAAFPSFATEETIGEIARDRDILLFPEQTRAAKEAALKDWLPAHQDDGLPYGILRQSQHLWSPDRPMVRLVAGNSTFALWHTLDSDGNFSYLRTDNGSSNWDWDSEWTLGLPEPAKIHRMFLIIYAPTGYDSHTTAESAPFPGTLGCQQITHRMGLNLAAMANYWKAAGSILWGVILAYDPDSFNPEGSGAGYPDGTWFRAYVPGIGFNRLQTARYYQIRSPLV